MSGAWIAAFVALSAIVLLLAFLVLGTLRRLVPLLERAEAVLAASAEAARRSGLPPGALVPQFEARELGGKTLTDADLEGSRTVLFFLGSSCRACESFVADLEQGRVPDLAARLVVVAEDAEEAIGYAAAGVTVLVQEEHSLSRVFESDRVPHAFVIDHDARVQASGWPNDWEGLRNLVTEAEKGGGRDSDVAAAVVTT